LVGKQTERYGLDRWSFGADDSASTIWCVLAGNQLFLTRVLDVVAPYAALYT